MKLTLLSAICLVGAVTAAARTYAAGIEPPRPMHSGAVVHLNKQQQQQQQQQEQQQHQQEQQKAGSSNQGVIRKQHAAADGAKQKWEEFWASELPAGALID